MSIFTQKISLVPWGIYFHNSPLTISPSYPFSWSVPQNKSILLLNNQMSIVPLGANDAVNYWVITMSWNGSGGGFGNIYTQNTNVVPAGVSWKWLPLVTLNFPINNPVDNIAQIGFTFTKVNAPGNLAVGGPVTEMLYI